ncbi:MAG TPA: HDIG domain-containing protein [Polyangia bacterium]|jgi:hypothetical protein
MGMTRTRRPAGAAAGVVLSLLFAALLLPLATFDLWAPGAGLPPRGKPSRYALRVPDLGLFQGSMLGKPTYVRHRTVAAPGRTIADEDRPVLEAYLNRPHRASPATWLGLGFCFILGGLLFCGYMRLVGGAAALLRTQAAMLGAIVGFAVIGKALLVWTPLSPFYLPVALLTITVALHLERQLALAGAALAALAAAALVPFDFPLGAVLLMQGVGAALMIRRRRPSKLQALAAGVAGSLVGVVTYVGIHFLLIGRIPDDDFESLASSGLLGTAAAGLGSGILALLFAPVTEHLLGEVTRARLMELADLEAPLLKKIATEAPGTWQHSLAVANLAEIAANSIGANALLCRVGAYYHDAGKTYEPSYFVENRRPGERNPHDGLAPEASVQAIFEHVAAGERLARSHGLPDAVLEFVVMHHGNSLMEYFWNACQKQGNPQRLTERDFSYPGAPPHSRETAILALCDSVEAASRTLKQPDERAIENLVEHIIFAKLMNRQLDLGGLTPEELRKIGDSLIATLRNSFHVRVEYPWQQPEGEIPMPVTMTPSGAIRLPLAALAAAADLRGDDVPSVPANGEAAAAAPAAAEPPSPSTVTSAAPPNGTVHYAYTTESSATVTSEPVEASSPPPEPEPPRVASPVDGEAPRPPGGPVTPSR